MNISLIILLFAGCQPDLEGDTATMVIEDAGHLSLGPDALEFGAITLADTAVDTVRLANMGQGDLAIQDIRLGDDSLRPHWTISPADPHELAPGAEIILTIQAHPLALGDLSVELEILSDDPDTALTTVPLGLTGVGVPKIRIEPPESLDFGEVTLGESASAGLVIMNEGTDVLTVSHVSITTGTEAFAVEIDPTGTTIAPRTDEAYVGIQFTPDLLGALLGSLYLETSDPDSPGITISLLGTGVSAK